MLVTIELFKISYYKFIKDCIPFFDVFLIIRAGEGI